MLTIERNQTCVDGMMTGRVLVADREIAKSMEPSLPGNRLPAGTYDAFIRADGKLGWRIELKTAPVGWTNVQIHIGNYPSQTKGCILVGTSVATRKNPTSGREECATVDSASALSAIAGEMQKAAKTSVSSQPIEIQVVIR
jgi:hypothetical protein